MILTHYFLKHKIRSLIKKVATRTHYFRTLKKIQRILVLYNVEDQEKVEPCLETLRMMHKEVKACVYVPEGLQPLTGESDIPIYACKDLTLWGFPSETRRRELNTYQADLLIDLSRPSCLPMQYVLLQHPCTFRVGIKRNEYDMYDMAISVTDRDDIEYLFGHILFYLQSIRSN